MPIEGPGIRLSELDTARFGVRTARADGLDAQRIDEALAFCRANGVQLMIVRCSVEDVEATHALGSAGFLLMDTLVYYGRDLGREPVAAAPPGPIELLRPGDEDQVEAIARECFRTYAGHYHADVRLDRDACTEVYASWARALCEIKEPAGFVLVAGEAGRRLAFCGFRLTEPDTGELVLGAVLQPARGAGLYGRLTTAGMLKLQSWGARRFVTSTHLSNWSAQASWAAIGLRPDRAFHTFHRWFDGD